MAEHQNLGRVLRNHYKKVQRGHEQYNLHQDFSRISWQHSSAQLDKLEPVPGKTKTVTDEVDARDGGVEADEQLKLIFNMDHSFVIEKEAYTTSVTMEIPDYIRQDIAGVPEKVVFPHVGEHIINIKNTCPLPSHLTSENGRKLKLRFEEKVYNATVRVRTVFLGMAVFGRTGVAVTDAIKSHSRPGNQFLSDGSFVSTGSCKIITRKYLGTME